MFSQPSALPGLIRTDRPPKGVRISGSVPEEVADPIPGSVPDQSRISGSPRVKVYSRHNCERTHRTYRALAKCMWPRAEWITGSGPYATLARCRVLTVQLHPTLDGARSALAVINRSGCGGRCPCTGAGHDLVQLADPSEAAPW